MAFERIAETIYSMLPKKKSEMNQVEQMGVVFTSGYIAGILCGAVSHPADTLVSKINKLKMDGSFGQKASHIYGEIGFSGLWKGFTPRVIMVFIFFFFFAQKQIFFISHSSFFFFPPQIGTLTGLQWFIYGAFKTFVGLPAPGASQEDLKKK